MNSIFILVVVITSSLSSEWVSNVIPLAKYDSLRECAANTHNMATIFKGKQNTEVYCIQAKE